MMIDGTRIALTLVFGVTVCLMTFASPLISRWMGPGFEASVLPLQVLAVTGIVLVGQGPLGNILFGTGRHRLVAFVSLGEAIANLILSVLLVGRYGIAGCRHRHRGPGDHRQSVHPAAGGVPPGAAHGSRLCPYGRGRTGGLRGSSLRLPAARSAALFLRTRFRASSSRAPWSACRT